ncbi:MAG: DUF559 domain-containing protein, partial [Acidobacteria bacterium]|nr:DUF559 domain-containing protein [Acidobacteriota bacterium]
DPPYGEKFGSNFQPFVRKRDVKHNEDEDMTREPEMVQAYRDTWELGLHSYLTYLRDRLLLCRELLAPSGSVFVQISDENLHHVREVMDEVFGAENFVSVISFLKTSGQYNKQLPTICDYIIWFAKDVAHIKYRQLYIEKTRESVAETSYGCVMLQDGTWRRMTSDERQMKVPLPESSRVFDLSDLTSSHEGPNEPYIFQGKPYTPKKRYWSTSISGLKRLDEAKRLAVVGDTLRYIRYIDDFPVTPLANVWDDTAAGTFTEEKLYVVQTQTKAIQRCILMTTDPGDLVLDPTCFRAGTRAKTETGWKAIEVIRPGERVWTHKGRWRRVIGVQSRPHTGRMLGIRVQGQAGTVWLTPEHRLLTAAVSGVHSPPHPLVPSPDVERGMEGEGGSAADPTPVPPPHAWGGGGRQAGGEVRPSTVHHALGGAPRPVNFQFARQLRQDFTKAEQTLWQHLRARQLAGAKFRRQHPLGPNFIVDFYCAEARLAVELDGSVHDSPRAHWADGIRHRQIQYAGARVLRFTNEEVLNDLEYVLAVIREHLTPALSGTPSPLAERGLGGEGGSVADPTPGPPPHKWGGGGRQAGGEVWRRADTLQPGDRVVAESDESEKTFQIESIETTFTQEVVYDLTVEEDHSFVTEIGVAHNCGSGTTAYVAEQWGRRWITIDVSRVPLALARQRLLTATFPWYELKDESRGPAGGFVYKRKQNSKGEEVGGIVPHITLKSIANNEPPAEEVLVDRPEVTSGITRVTGPFCFEATIPTPVDWEGDGVEDSGAVTVESRGSFVDRMLEVLRKSPVLRLEGNRTVTFKNVRPPARSLSLSAEALVTDDGEKPVAFVFGPENGAVSEKLVYEAAREAYAKSYTHLHVIGFAIEPKARELVENCGEVVGVPATYVQATPDLMMGDLLKNMRSSQIFSVCGLPEVKIHHKDTKNTRQYQVELLGLDVFDPVTMEVDHQSGDDVPAWFLDTDYNNLCFHVCQAFFPRTSAWENLRKALKAEYEESVWEHLAGRLSAPFEAGQYGQIAVKVIDDRGNELLVVKSLNEAEP